MQVFSLVSRSTDSDVFPTEKILMCFGGADRALCAVRKVRCFPPPVAMGPRVLNSAPYSPCWYARDFFFSLMLATGPMVLSSAPPMLF